MLLRLVFFLVTLCAVAVPVWGQFTCDSAYVTLTDPVGYVQFDAPLYSGACWVLSPSPNVTGREFKSIAVTASLLDIPFSGSFELYDGVVPSNPWKLGGLTASDTLPATISTIRFGSLFIYLRGTGTPSGNSTRVTFTWEASAEVRFTQSLALFVGTTVGVGLPVLSVCLIKFTCRKKFIKQLPDKSGPQRINPRPPKKEQIIAWISVGVGVGLFILFSARYGEVDFSPGPGLTPALCRIF